MYLWEKWATKLQPTLSPNKNEPPHIFRGALLGRAEDLVGKILVEISFGTPSGLGKISRNPLRMKIMQLYDQQNQNNRFES